MICIGMMLKLISLTFDWTLWDWLHTRGDYSDTHRAIGGEESRKRSIVERGSVVPPSLLASQIAGLLWSYCVSLIG